MGWQRNLAAGIIGVALCCRLVSAQQPAVAELDIDSDHDGLSDRLEQELLTQFLPTFMIGEHDCSVRPAEFRTDSVLPVALAENGTVYGQATPARALHGHTQTVELHYYDLWRTDCGPHGHALDAEHVAVLVQRSDLVSGPAEWKALYWYAAAHEDTVCDVSQIARASTLQAEERGATVWISPGKHAAYLNSTLCQRGCGADRCEKMTELAPAKLINLGEPGHSMNGSVFISSSAWPLEYKMSNSNFPADAVARVEQLPATDIAWFHPGHHPAQGVISGGVSTEQALALSRDDTAAAISVAGDSTGEALANAKGNTGNALQKSYGKTKHALGKSARSVGRALHGTPKADPQQ
jgi:hypothetical protein